MEKFVLRLSKIFNYAAMALLFILAALDTADLLGRYLLNRPIEGTLEISEILLAGTVMLAWGHTQSENGHVSVRFLVAKFSPWVQRILDFSTSLIMLVLMGLIVWQGTETAISYWCSNRLITTIEWPLYPFQLFAPLGALIFCLVLIVQMRRHLISQKKET